MLPPDQKPAPWNRFQFRLRTLALAVLAIGLGLGTAPPGLLPLAFLPIAVGVAAWWMSPWILIPSMIVLVFSAMLELLLLFPVPAWLYLSTAIGCTASLWPRTPEQRRPGRLAPMAGLCAAIALLFFVPWSSRKPFVRALDSIRPGMTEAEVRHRMAGYKTGTGWFIPGQAEEVAPPGSIVFRHSDEPAFNADWGVVTFVAGRVVSVRFDLD